MSKKFNDELPNITDRLKAIQKEQRLTNSEMAAALGVSESHYKYRILKGVQAIGSDQLFMLFEQFNISIDYLFSGEEASRNIKAAEQMLNDEKFNEILSKLEDINKNVCKIIDKEENH